MAALRPIRTVVAILLVIEAAVLFFYGATWIVPHIVVLTIAAGLLFPAITGAWRIALAVVAGGYAALFVFPGSMWLMMGACGGTLGSTCSSGAFYLGVAGYVAAAAVNIAAVAVLLARTTAPTPPPPAEPRR